VRVLTPRWLIGTAAAVVLIDLLGGPCGLAAQQSSAQTPASPGATFRSVVRLIVQTVTVKDKNGRAIEGLTPSDFVVTEDGEPQTVAFAEFQQLETTPAVTSADADLKVSGPPVNARVADVPGTTATTIATGTPGSIRYGSRRLLVLYFDLTSMGQQDLLRAYNAARTFVTTQMTASDLVAVIAFQGAGVRVMQDFTDDRPKLLSAVESLAFGADADGNGIATGLEQGTAFGQDDPEFQIFNTDRQLSALQSAIEMLRPLAEQKALIYFASGLQLNGVNNQAQLRATTNAALRANVAIYPVDSRGLVATSPLGDATRASPGGLTMFSGQAAGLVVGAFQHSQDTLFSLAKDTGGKAMFDDNDLSMGIVDAARALSSYYIVGFYSSHTALDGKFHRVRITVGNPRAADVSYRQGYYADTEFAKFTDADKERQLEQALLLDNPITELTIATEINYFQLNRAEYFVPVAMKIPGSELAQASRTGAVKASIDFIGEVKDEFGNTAQNVRDKIDVKLSGETAAQLQRRPILYQTGFTLLPGQYSLKVLARDAETGHIGTYQTTFVIPNLEREATRLPTSSVVLSSQRVDPNDALFSVKTTKDAQAADPLIVDGQKVIPSVTRVFSRSRSLYVFLQAYERGAATTDPLVATVGFYQSGSKLFEAPITVVTDGLDPRSKAVPVWFDIPLGALRTGRYDLQVTVARPSDRKVTFWRAPIAIVE
jgi:VWFA-related protein